MIHIFEIPVEKPKKEGTKAPVPQARPSRSKKIQRNAVHTVESGVIGDQQFFIGRHTFTMPRDDQEKRR